jgi:hypothetical protein
VQALFIYTAAPVGESQVGVSGPPASPLKLQNHVNSANRTCTTPSRPEPPNTSIKHADSSMLATLQSLDLASTISGHTFVTIMHGESCISTASQSMGTLHSPRIQTLERNTVTEWATSANENMLLHACFTCISTGKENAMHATVDATSQDPEKCGRDSTETALGLRSALTLLQRVPCSDSMQQSKSSAASRAAVARSGLTTNSHVYSQLELCTLSTAVDMVRIALLVLDLRLGSQSDPSRISAQQLLECSR